MGIPSVKKGTHGETSEEILLISKYYSPVEEAYVDQNYQNIFAPGLPSLFNIREILYKPNFHRPQLYNLKNEMESYSEKLIRHFED